MTALVVAVVALVVLVLLLVVGFVLLQRLRGQAATAGHALGEELSQDPPVHGPAEAEYAGGTVAGLPRHARGVLVLTATRLLFRDVSGNGLGLARADVQDVGVETDVDGVRPAPRRKGVPAPVHLVVHSPAGVAAFVVDDPDGWASAVRGADGPTGSGVPDVSPG